MDVRVLYGNAQAGYQLTQRDWDKKIPAQIALVINSGAAVFLAVEMHEETHSSFGAAGNAMTYFLNKLKAADPDWALLPGKAGNQCYYRPSKVNGVGAVNKQMPGDRHLSDFRLQDAATTYEWHGVLTHFRANDPDYYTPKTHKHRDGRDRTPERKKQGKFTADYAAPIQRALIAGDFNSSTEQAGYPRATIKAAGFTGLRERGPVVNGKRSTKSTRVKDDFWIEDIFTRKAQRVSDSQLLLTNGASDHNGWLVTTVTWPDAPGPAVSPDVRPVQSSSRATYTGLPWDARVRTPDLRVGAPVRFTAAKLVENYCAPSTLTLSGRTSDLDAAAVVGQGIVLTDDQGAIRCSGPLTAFERQGADGGQLLLTFRSDTFETATRIVWPNPAGAWSKAGQPNAYHVLGGPAETRLLSYVALHLGGSARPERRLGVYATGASTYSQPLDFRLPASLGRGPTASTSARFDVLGELAATLAEAAGLHFGIRQAYDGLTPYLELYLDDAPDLSSWVRFGTPEAGGPYLLGEAWKYSGGVPTGSTILGAAGGEGADRILNAATNVAAEKNWHRRFESFLDQRSQTDPTEIAEGLAKAMLERDAASEISVPLGSIPGIGTTIPLGAKAAATLDGQTYVERIRQITTVLSAQGNTAPAQVGAVLGTPDAGIASPTWRQLNRMLTRLRELEHR